MSTKWEIKRVSTPERIFDKIKTEMAQPVGIVLFGADCDLKNEVWNTMMSELQGFARYYTNAPDTATLVKALKNYSAVAVALNGEESSSHELRHELVKVMQNAGAESVVGIFAKCEMPKPLPARGYFKKKTATLARQVTSLAECPPTPDGLTYLLVVNKE